MINLADPILGKVELDKNGRPKTQTETNFDKFLNQSIKDTVDMMFKIMVKQAQTLMPGDEKTDIAQSVLAVANGIQLAKNSDNIQKNTDISKGLYGINISALEGHKVQHPSNILDFDGRKADITVDIPKGAMSTMIQIVSKAGDIVYEHYFQQGAVGRQKFTWDGTYLETGEEAPKGEYFIKSHSLNESGKMLIDPKTEIPIEATVYVKSFVTEVEIDDKGAPTLISGNKRIREIDGYQKYGSAKPVIVLNQPQSPQRQHIPPTIA